MAYEYESKETRVLKTIDSQRYPETNKDFVKNIRRLNSSVDYISSYMRIMQKGIDDANKSFIEQIQSFINDLIVIFAGGEPTGIELGDLKYILQAIGALFGFNGPFPINLFNAAAHFFQGFLAPITQLSDLIFDTIEAWMLDLIDKAGNIPLIGGAVVSIAQWIIDSSNGIQQAIEAAADAFAHAGEIIDSFLRALGVPTWADVEKWFENLFGGLLYGIDFGDGFDLFEAAQWFINVVLFPVNLLAKLVGGFLEVFRIPGLDASKITSGTFAQSMISGLVDALGNLGKFINDVIDAIEGAFRGIPIIGSGIANMINGIQQFFNGLFGAPTPQPTIQAPAVPGIDATKVTTGTFGSGQIADAAVTQSKIANSAVSGEKIVDSAVSSGKIADSAVSSGKIADLAVGTTKVADSAITGAKTTTLDATKITSGTITPGIIGNASITGTKIAPSTIVGSNLANDTITATQIATDTITSDEIAPSTITATELSSPLKYSVGSGAISTRVTTDTPSKLNTGTYRIGGYFNVIPTDTPDITRAVLTGSPGGLVAYRVTNDGWYQVSLCYALNPQLSSNAVTNNLNWSLAPCVFTGSTATGVTLKQVGPDFYHGVFIAALAAYGWGARTAQASFILYLTANTYVAPGMSVYLGGGATNQDLLSNGLGDGTDNYFSISLLNRSLA